MSEKKIKMTFGLQEHQIKRINDERARWNQPDKDIPGTPPDAILIEGFWEQLGREFGWAPFTLALHYMKAERRVDNNTGYRSLWDYLHFNHGLKLLESEVGDLVHFVHKFYPKNESPAEQPVVDNELKQEVDHLEKKISLCEDALEKLHAERYETRLALGRLLKVFKNDQISKEQEKYYSQAEYILNKHSKTTDVLRTEAPEQPVREVEFVIAYTPCLDDDPDYSGDYTSNDGRELCHLKEIRVPVSAIKQSPAEWSGEKEK